MIPRVAGSLGLRGNRRRIDLRSACPGSNREKGIPAVLGTEVPLGQWEAIGPLSEAVAFAPASLIDQRTVLTAATAFAIAPCYAGLQVSIVPNRARILTAPMTV